MKEIEYWKRELTARNKRNIVRRQAKPFAIKRYDENFGFGYGENLMIGVLWCMSPAGILKSALELAVRDQVPVIAHYENVYRRRLDFVVFPDGRIAND